MEFAPEWASILCDWFVAEWYSHASSLGKVELGYSALNFVGIEGSNPSDSLS